MGRLQQNSATFTDQSNLKVKLLWWQLEQSPAVRVRMQLQPLPKGADASGPVTQETVLAASCVTIRLFPHNHCRHS